MFPSKTRSCILRGWYTISFDTFPKLAGPAIRESVRYRRVESELTPTFLAGSSWTSRTRSRPKTACVWSSRSWLAEISSFTSTTWAESPAFRKIGESAKITLVLKQISIGHSCRKKSPLQFTWEPLRLACISAGLRSVLQGERDLRPLITWQIPPQLSKRILIMWFRDLLFRTLIQYQRKALSELFVAFLSGMIA